MSFTLRLPLPPSVNSLFRDLPPLQTELSESDQDLALSMFRDELRDTEEIALRLEATEAAVANGIARARERERQWR